MLQERHGTHVAGIRRVCLPMRGAMTPYVNAYLIEDDDGYTLVDCGYGTDDVAAVFDTGLHELGIDLKQIRRVISTHFHADHAGQAGRLKARTDLVVMMHAADWALLKLQSADFTEAARRRDRWLERNGLPASPRRVSVEPGSAAGIR